VCRGCIREDVQHVGFGTDDFPEPCDRVDRGGCLDPSDLGLVVIFGDVARVPPHSVIVSASRRHSKLTSVRGLRPSYAVRRNRGIATSLPSARGEGREQPGSNQMSTYETQQNVEPARIPTIARARKQWRREGVVPGQTETDFLRTDTPEAVKR